MVGGLQWRELGCFLQLVGRCGWFWSRAVVPVSWMTSFSCSSDVKAVRSPWRLPPSSAHARMHRSTSATRGYSVFQSPWGCHQVTWSGLQPRQNEERAGPSWLAAGRGLSLPDWVAVPLYGNLWRGCKDAEDARRGRTGVKRLCVYRERRKTPSWNCFQACPQESGSRAL